MILYFYNVEIGQVFLNYFPQQSVYSIELTARTVMDRGCDELWKRSFKKKCDLHSMLHRLYSETESISDAKRVAVQAQDAPMSALSMKSRCGSIGTGPGPPIQKSKNPKKCQVFAN